MRAHARYYEGLTDAEITSVLGRAPGTVCGYAARALSTLRIEAAATHQAEVRATELAGCSR